MADCSTKKKFVEPCNSMPAMLASSSKIFLVEHMPKVFDLVFDYSKRLGLNPTTVNGVAAKLRKEGLLPRVGRGRNVIDATPLDAVRLLLATLARSTTENSAKTLQDFAGLPLSHMVKFDHQSGQTMRWQGSNFITIAKSLDLQIELPVSPQPLPEGCAATFHDFSKLETALTTIVELYSENAMPECHVPNLIICINKNWADLIIERWADDCETFLSTETYTFTNFEPEETGFHLTATISGGLLEEIGLLFSKEESDD